MKTRIVTLVMAIVLCLDICVSVTGCGGPTPTETVVTYLDAVKAQDREALSKVYAGETDDLFDFDVDEEDPLNNKELKKAVTKMFYDFDYEILDESINDNNTATVKVKITTYPIGKAMNDFIEDVVPQMVLFAFMDEEESSAKMDEIHKKSVLKIDEKSYCKEGELYLIKGDDGWTVDSLEDNEKFANILSGGLLGVLKDFDNTYGEK